MFRVVLHRPESFLHGLLLLKESIGKENRPLSWTIGDQGIHKAEKPIIRDLMNERRMAAINSNRLKKYDFRFRTRESFIEK